MSPMNEMILRHAVKNLEFERDAALKRAEAAEAEVARLKALLEKRPAEPYTPRVGDVVLFDGERRDSAEELPRIVTTVEPDGSWSCVHINRRGDVAAGPFRLNSRINCAVRLHRLATPAERAAAGLPAEAPAKPEVLPEHLAWIEAHAASWGGEGGSMTRADKAARALLAAVARRDGGGK